MAVNLKYRQIGQHPDWVDYDIHTGPADTAPVRVRFFTAPDAPTPVVHGEEVAANKAIRQILQRRVTEGAWPRGGLIQS